MQLAFHPKSVFTAARNSRKINKLQKDIAAVMADPDLDSNQKYRGTKRLCALLDLQKAACVRREIYQETLATFRRAEGLSIDARIKSCNRNLKGLIQQLLAAEREVTRMFWQSGKLHVFASWGEVRLFERFCQVVPMIMHGLVSPVWRFGLRTSLLMIRRMELPPGV
jgi:hypothetical protein